MFLGKESIRQRLIFILHAILLIASCGLLIANDGGTNVSSFEVRVQEVKAISSGIYDANMKEKTKDIIRGHEVEAVDYAVNNTYRTNAGYNRACIVILRAFEKEALVEFKRRFASGQEIAPLMRRTLWLWGASTTIYEGFCLAIDENINHTEQGEDTTRESIGIPKRLCDLAYNLALDRIENAGDLFGTHRQRGRNTDPLTSRDKIPFRDETIAVFKTWWKENKDFLEWSVEKKKFVVNQDAKKAGIPVNKK